MEVSIFKTTKWWKQWHVVIVPSLSLLVRPCVYVWAQRSRAVDELAAVSRYACVCGRARTVTARAVDRPPSVVHQPVYTDFYASCIILSYCFTLIVMTSAYPKEPSCNLIDRFVD